jgi:two-component system phosphate regulon response regulator PhoB
VRNEAAHVLIVDDFSDLRDTLCLQITELGYHCEAVESGAQALAVLAWWKPIVVVIEWSLRDGSGVGLSRKLREWAFDAYRPLLVIMYSQRAETDEVRAAESYDQYISKPGSPGEVGSAVLKFLSA